MRVHTVPLLAKEQAVPAAIVWAVLLVSFAISVVLWRGGRFPRSELALCWVRTVEVPPQSCKQGTSSHSVS